MTLVQTARRSKRYALMHEGALTASGELRDGDYLATSLDVVADEDDNAFLDAVPVDALDPLPAAGVRLEAGDLYDDNGRAVMVRQEHTRTEHPVDDLVPTLFLVYRADVDGIEWITGESVVIGTIRTFESETYRCKQGHITQSDWWPSKDGVLGVLWEVYEEPQPGEQWVDSGEAVTSLIGAGTIGVTDTEPFAADQQIRIAGEHEATVSYIHTAGSPGVLVIDPHVNVSGGESVEIWQ